MPTNPSPSVPHLHVSWTLPGMVTPPLPWQLDPMHYLSTLLILSKRFSLPKMTSPRLQVRSTRKRPPKCYSVSDFFHYLFFLKEGTICFRTQIGWNLREKRRISSCRKELKALAYEATICPCTLTFIAASPASLKPYKFQHVLFPAQM